MQASYSIIAYIQSIQSQHIKEMLAQPHLLLIQK